MQSGHACFIRFMGMASLAILFLTACDKAFFLFFSVFIFLLKMPVGNYTS
jgi:hypothetical protein